MNVSFDMFNRALLDAGTRLEGLAKQSLQAAQRGDLNTLSKLQVQIAQQSTRFQFVQSMLSLFLDLFKRIAETIRGLGR
ncbi:MAG: hypothetical protein N2654_07715 [Deltaproteobacteria bacterium]|nr:hypothetical protein [Deltaproteobacteria bacterium]